MERQLRARTSEAMVLGVVCALVLIAGSGCQQYARIAWGAPKPVQVENKTLLAVGDLSELKRRGGIWDKQPSQATIGKHTFTVFAIPVGSINAHQTTPLKQSFDRGIRQALEATGYELVSASDAAQDTPVLRGEVRACWWWSYTWFWPLTIQGGENKVVLFLEQRDGTVLWQHAFSRIEPGMAFGGAYGFDSMVKWSMTKLLQDIVRECSSERFKAVLRKG